LSIKTEMSGKLFNTQKSKIKGKATPGVVEIRFRG